MKAIKGIIYGKVQGVFFRKYTKQKAEELNIKGFVKNEKDGTVYFEAEGANEKLEKFIQWCHQGSPGADVSKVDTEESDVKNYPDFKIKY